MRVVKQWIEAVPGGHKARIRYPNGYIDSGVHHLEHVVV